MIKVAMIGVGAISGIYLKNLTLTFQEAELIGVCDLIPERAEKGVQYVRDEVEKGAKAVIPKIYKDMYEAFDDPEVDVILNLTRPYEHYEVTKQALLHGKHVFSESPWPSIWKRRTSSWNLPRKPACIWAARRIPSWAPGFRPAANSLTTASSAT